MKTTLQRAVQALKRHRDIYFLRRPEQRPASIIITTLAAQSYAGGGSIAGVLVEVLTRMPQFVQERDGVWWVPNPVLPAENFADRWRKHPELADSFFAWLRQARSDFLSLAKASGVDGTLTAIGKCLGQDSASAAGAALGSGVAALSGAGQLGLGSSSGTLSPSPARPASRHTFYGGDAAPRLP